MSHNFKILQIIPELQTGGAEQTTLDIGQALVSREWASYVASAGGRMVDRLTSGGSHHIELPLNSKNPYTIWRNAGRLAKIIKDEKIDLIHARSRAPAWSSLIAARQTNIPFVTTYHGAYNENSKLKALYNSVMARADQIIANSHWTADLIRNRNPWAKDKITVIHRGTDFDSFVAGSIAPERLATLRQNWNITPDDQVVLHLARITGWKGQNVVIDAAARIAADFPAVKFVLAGDAQGREEYLAGLKKQIQTHGLEDTVLLPGHCSDPAAAMAIANIVVVASIEAEAFGRAAVEAGALEKPVIVTRIGAVGETVLAVPDVPPTRRTGWKVEPGSSTDLAGALRDVMTMDEAERIGVGKRARLHGKEAFSLEQMCSKTIAVYGNLLLKNL